MEVMVQGFLLVITLASGEVLMHHNTTQEDICETSSEYFLNMIQKKHDDAEAVCLPYSSPLVKKELGLMS